MSAVGSLSGIACSAGTDGSGVVSETNGTTTFSSGESETVGVTQDVSPVNSLKKYSFPSAALAVRQFGGSSGSIG